MNKILCISSYINQHVNLPCHKIHSVVICKGLSGYCFQLLHCKYNIIYIDSNKYNYCLFNTIIIKSEPVLWSGEIVNFMSTDTDRIVNFAPSFHQFWSLPIQVGISLYLLYNEVGLAFLAGIGFAILLIPINRYLLYCLRPHKLNLWVLGLFFSKIYTVGRITKNKIKQNWTFLNYLFWCSEFFQAKKK